MRLCLFLCLFLVAGVAVAQRVDVYDGALTQPTNRVAVLADLPDGGAQLVEVCARMASADGGAQIQACDQVRRDLKNQNQATALQVLDKAGNLWCSRQSACASDSGL